MTDLQDEAKLFAKYLINVSPGDDIVQRYVHAIQVNPLEVSSSDEKVLGFIHNNPWSIGLINSALALVKPLSEVRRRMYLMFAILEAAPEYTSYFLPVKRKPAYLFVVFFAGFRAVLKSIFGIVLYKIVS